MTRKLTVPSSSPASARKRSKEQAGPRRVVVTGGATGIGWGISQAFAESGAHVVIAQRTTREAREGAARLRRAGHNAYGVEADVGTREGARALAEGAVQALGGIDVLVNNAAVSGTTVMDAFDDFDDDLLDLIFEVNLKGPFRCTREALPHMPKGSTIINISSIGGFTAQYHAAAYCASKGGLVMLTKALAIELAERGLRVVGIAPGDIRTQRSQGAADYWAEQQPDRYNRVNPIGRRGTPADIAQAALYAASPEASFITGTTLVIDGGRLAY